MNHPPHIYRMSKFAKKEYTNQNQNKTGKICSLIGICQVFHADQVDIQKFKFQIQHNQNAETFFFFESLAP